jgi:hypothetical protein
MLTYTSPVTDPYSCNPPQIGCAGQITYSWPTMAVNPGNPCSSVTTATTLKPGYMATVATAAAAAQTAKEAPPLR